MKFISKNSEKIVIASALVILLAVLIGCNDSPAYSKSPANKQIEQARQTVLKQYTELSDQDTVTAQESYGLLMLYCNRYLARGGQSIPELETFLIYNIGDRAAGYGLTSLVRNEIDIPFTGILLSKMLPGNESETILFEHSRLMFNVMEIWHKSTKSSEDWNNIIVLMNTANAIKPTYQYQEALEESYRSLGMDRELFTLKAYQAFDLGSEGNLGADDLRKLWGNISGDKLTLDEEIKAVNNLVMRDIVRQSEVRNDFQLSDERFTLGDGDKEYRIKFQNVESSSFGKPLIVTVFASDCPYCEEELRVLSDLNQEYEDKVAIVALREKDGGNIDSYIRKNKISVPMLVNDESRILSELDISSVPVLFLFDDDGKLRNKFRFRSTANLNEKITWLLEYAIQ